MVFALLVVIAWVSHGIYEWSRMDWLENDIVNMLASNSRPMTFEEIRKDLYKYGTDEIRRAVDSAVDKNHILTTTRRLTSQRGEEYEIRFYSHPNWGIRE